MRVKLKSKHGSGVLSVGDYVTIGSFLEAIKLQHPSLLGEESVVAIKVGFPPITVDINPQKTLTEAGINNGDQVILELGTDGRKGPVLAAAPTLETQKVVAAQSEIPSVYMSAMLQFLILRNIPDDNSCMFNSISYALFGCHSYKPGNVSPASNLRTIVADEIRSRPDQYDEVVLGRPVGEYCEWILKKDSWGGAIELGILAQYFGIRINCIDIELGNFIRFESETQKARNFINLIYSGIHYDLLAANKVLTTNESDKEKDVAVWVVDGSASEYVLAAAREVCLLLQSKNYATNTTKFRVRCLECYEVLVGEMGASKHANSTGHFRFGEVKEE